MEGKATFTLTEAKTGRVVREVTEHNLVTDAVKRILNPPMYASAYDYNYSGFMSSVLPMWQLFSGIVLLENNLVEDKGNVMFGPDCKPVATAGGAYSGTNTRRGSLNQNETYATENGYHFTWDFATDKANGTIRSVALTSPQFGNSGLEAEGTSGLIMLSAATPMPGTGLRTKFLYAEGQYIGTFEDETHTFLKNTYTDGVVRFMKYRYKNPSDIGLNDKPALTAAVPIFTTEVTIPTAKHLSYKTFYDPKTKLLYIFSKMYQDSEGYYIEYSGISMQDFTVKDTGKQRVKYRTWYTAAAKYDGKFYVLSDVGTEEYSFDGTLEKTYSFGYTNGWFSTKNGILIVTNGDTRFAEIVNGEQYTFYNDKPYIFGYSCDIKPPYYPAYHHDSTNAANAGVWDDPFLCIAADYFATINNLSEPLEKTSEHTLKITYDITN